MQDYIYSVLSIVAIAIHLIINFDMFADRAVHSEGTRRYRGFLLSMLVYYISDAAWGLIAGLRWTALLYADTVLYFLSLAAFNVAWCNFVVAHLRLSGWRARVLKLVGYAFLVFNLDVGRILTAEESNL